VSGTRCRVSGAGLGARDTRHGTNYRFLPSQTTFFMTWNFRFYYLTNPSVLSVDRLL